MLGALGSLASQAGSAIATGAAGAASSAGSKLDSLINGPQKAVLVLHHTYKEQSGRALGSTSKNFGDIIDATKEQLAEDGRDSKVAASIAKGDYVLQVQYNPSSIDLTAAADSMPIKPLQPSFDANVPLSASVPPSIIMKIELIFDDIVVPDAFMHDKFNVSAGNIANDIALNMDTSNGKAHSVQPVTNGLLAAMQRSRTRSISLYWADLHFHGEIKDMQARYTLFSVSGRPIRSIVSMTLVQNTEADDDVINGYWEDSLDAIFPRDELDPMKKDKYSARAMAQKMGAMLNINF